MRIRLLLEISETPSQLITYQHVPLACDDLLVLYRMDVLSRGKHTAEMIEGKD